jgi:hypothetical protein
MLKTLLIVLGSISLLIGIIGIVVPGLPTTPFLLLTAGLYLKSSDKLYNKLVTNKILGKYILNYQKNKAISLSTKIYSISIMWVMISISSVFFIQHGYVKILLIVLGIIGTIVMYRIPVLKDKS